jgi:hypothetical protein
MDAICTGPATSDGPDEGKTGYFYEYGEILTEPDGIDWRQPVALYPPQRDVRLSAQRGYFTIHGFDINPLDEIAARPRDRRRSRYGCCLRH